MMVVSDGAGASEGLLRHCQVTTPVNSCKSATLGCWWKNKHRPIVFQILEGPPQKELCRMDALFV